MSTPNPDQSIPTSASGPALSLVTSHNSPAGLTLYGGWFCPFVQRVWLVLEELDISYGYVEINPYNKTPEFLKLNPRGLVPALGLSREGGEDVIYESLVCCEFLNDVYGSGKGSGANGDGKDGGQSVLLLPEDPLKRAHARIWIDFASTRIIPAYYKLLQHSTESTYTLADARATYLQHLKTWIRASDADGPYFLGKQFSLVDIVLAPWLVRNWIIDHFKNGGTGIPTAEEVRGGENEEVWSRWRVWAAAVEGRKSVKETQSEEEDYVKAYQRYADDTAQSEVAKATRDGGKLP